MEQNEIEKAAITYGEDHGEWITNVHQYFTGDAMIQGFEAGAEWANEQKGWISVEDRMPEVGSDVLVYRDYSEYNRECRIDIGRIHFTEMPQHYGGPSSLGGQGVLTGYYWSFPAIVHPKLVTHWMPLPTKPTK